MAQRSVIIKLARPRYRATWEQEVRDYARQHRWEIIADVRDRLQGEQHPVTPRTRWATWESEVLAHMDKLAECQEIIAKRQETVDDDNSDRVLVAAHFGQRL
jgi:hypothetical protein